LLGLVLFFPEYSSWRGQMGVYVQDPYLRSAARGRGIGRALLAQAFKRAADWEPQFLTLIVAKKNINARGFYENLGFSERDSADPLLPAGKGLAALISADDPMTTAHGGIEREIEFDHFVLTYIHFEDII